jgi:hypothetical protein
MSTEEKIKHLEFVQAVITRMAQNSFMYKGWAITVLAGGFSVSKDMTTQVFLLTTLPALLSFWLLDSLYLRQERLFRKLYSDVVNDNASVFSMNAQKYASTCLICDLCSIMFSWSVVWLYAPMILLVIIVGFVKRGKW